MILTSELQDAHLEELHVAATRIDNAREDRDVAITDAYRDGVAVNEIAKAVGMTRQRVWQIVNT